MSQLPQLLIKLAYRSRFYLLQQSFNLKVELLLAEVGGQERLRSLDGLLDKLVTLTAFRKLYCGELHFKIIDTFYYRLQLLPFLSLGCCLGYFK